eukprot:2023653-Pleurochrysis_carterae.AAC.1
MARTHHSHQRPCEPSLLPSLPVELVYSLLELVGEPQLLVVHLAHCRALRSRFVGALEDDALRRVRFALMLRQLPVRP